MTCPATRFRPPRRAVHLLAACMLLAAGTARAADALFEVLEGDMPLVISAPHGGLLRPDGVPDRGASNPGCPRGKAIVVATDADTGELAQAIRQRFLERDGRTPWVVIARVSRRKADLNRDLAEAACGDPRMEQLWKDWHAAIERALRAAAKDGPVLYIDLHGHGHPRQRLELGYGMSAARLRALAGRPSATGTAADDDEALPDDSERGTLAQLPSLARGKTSLRALLTGDEAFGTLVARHGLPAVPSRDDPAPDGYQPYFNGGYNARRYTGPAYPGVFGWQIEVHRNARTPWQRASTATALVDAIDEFLQRQLSAR